MPRYQVTRTTRDYLVLDVANAEQAIELAMLDDFKADWWRPKDDASISYDIHEIGPSPHDEEAEQENLEALMEALSEDD